LAAETPARDYTSPLECGSLAEQKPHDSIEPSGHD